MRLRGSFRKRPTVQIHPAVNGLLLTFGAIFAAVSL
jgi:hypothetical protein